MCRETERGFKHERKSQIVTVPGITFDFGVLQQPVTLVICGPEGGVIWGGGGKVKVNFTL
jgi:hypothetical protein